MPDIRVNMINRVDSKAIRIENHEGEPHIVIPSYTLPDNVVMNGGLYPKEEIDRAWPTMEGTLAPIGHPTNNNGEWISAFSSTGIHKFHGGAFNRNTRREGHRVYTEKVINIDYAQRTEPGKRLLEAIGYDAATNTVAGPKSPIHTSTGLLLQQDSAPPGASFDWIARNMRLDHDAILLDEPGAATPEQGVGMMVNCSDAVRVQNLGPDTANARRDALDQAIRTRFGENAWVRDFDDESLVYRTDAGNFQIDYQITAEMTVELGTESTPVKEKTTWVKTLIANLWDRVAPSKTPITNQPKGEDDYMPLSQEDLQAIGGLIGNTVAEKLQPLTERLEKQGEAITSLQTNTDQLTAQLKTNAEKQQAADKALVAEKHGEMVANSVAPEKLAELAAAIREGDGGEQLPQGGDRTNNSDQGQWGQVPTVGGK